jgi:hypothetical protein
MKNATRPAIFKWLRVYPSFHESEKLIHFAAPLPRGVGHIGGRRRSAFEFPEDFPKLLPFSLS